MERLPRKCFVSHAYKDAKALKLLTDNLPQGVELFTFPPIDVAPDEMVSNALIETILSHDGLIFFEGGYSAHSFWVAFERDYALRAKKRVFSFTPETLQIKPCSESALELHVFATYSRNDQKQVKKLAAFMKEKRFFNIWIPDEPPLSRDKHGKQIMRERITEKINRGGYAIFFWSQNAARSERVKDELEFAYKYNQYFNYENSQPDLGRVLFALLDNTPLPDWVQNEFQVAPKSVVKPVQLYGDNDFSVTSRLDDLIVRLYWLIHRNTQANNWE